MGYFISIGSSPRLLVSLNRYRVYLQLLLLSDMVSADGHNLVHHVLQGQKLTDKRSSLQWPKQHNPSKADWGAWERALLSLAPNGKLVQPIDMSKVVSHMEWWPNIPQESINCMPFTYRSCLSSQCSTSCL